MIHRMKRMMRTMRMMTGRTAPAAHHQKIVVTLIQTNLSHPLLEGAVPDTPPLATPLPENRERGFSSCELTACSNLAPYLYRARDKMGGQQLSPSPRPCNRLKVNQTTFLLLFFFLLTELCYMCGYRISFYCLYIGVLLKSVLAVLFFLF